MSAEGSDHCFSQFRRGSRHLRARADRFRLRSGETHPAGAGNTATALKSHCPAAMRPGFFGPGTNRGCRGTLCRCPAPSMTLFNRRPISFCDESILKEILSGDIRLVDEIEDAKSRGFNKAQQVSTSWPYLAETEYVENRPL